jgi:signal transduction histidine kinase
MPNVPPSPDPDHATRLAEAGAHLARVVHELNAPASLIQGGLQNLGEYLRLLLPHIAALERRLDGRGDVATAEVGYAATNAEGVLQICAESMQRLIDLIAELRIWTGARAQPFSLGATDLRDLVEDAVRLARAGRTLEVAIVRDIPAQLPPVIAHAESAGRAIANVIGNALDAVAHCARPLVAIRARAVASPGCGAPACVELRVRDNGPGIPVASRETVFEPFFTSKKGGEGLGLGLAIARDALRRGGGSIAVGACDGLGSELVIRLPVAPAATRAAL